MKLFLVRHGIAMERNDPKSPGEADRPLTVEGIKRTREAARGMAALIRRPQVLISSPYRRATQTAEIFALELDLAGLRIFETESLLPDAPPDEFLHELARIEAERVMAFGHAANLDLVIARAIGVSHAVTELKKAGVAGLEIRSFDPPRASLTALLAPKVLRRV